MCLYIHVYIHIYIYIHTFLYIYIERERDASKQKSKSTNYIHICVHMCISLSVSCSYVLVSLSSRVPTCGKYRPANTHIPSTWAHLDPTNLQEQHPKKHKRTPPPPALPHWGRARQQGPPVTLLGRLDTNTVWEAQGYAASATARCS